MIVELLKQIKEDPESVDFDQVISVINQSYNYRPTRFVNGEGELLVENPAGKNEGSCKIFSFAKLNNLSQAETLACFGKHYRDVLANPTGTDHSNIRAFMKFGWEQLHFEAEALQKI